MSKSVFIFAAAALLCCLAACGPAPEPAEASPIVAVVDAEASAEIYADFAENFGNPEDAIDWFVPVEKIEVKDGYTRFAVVTVSDATSDQVDRIGNAVFGNYAKDFALSHVSVVNENGTELFSRRS